jgi:hypothetical protein
MKTIIAGSREYDEIVNPRSLVSNGVYRVVRSILDRCPWEITEVVSGTCRGPDQLGERWGEEREVSIKCFPADWKGFGKRAGFIRNEEMAVYGEAAIIFWDGKSRGTKSMIDLALSHKLQLLVVQVNIAPVKTVQ